MGFAEDVRAGLTDDPKWLLPKYFYDDRGSALYERITELDAYYPPRVERSILASHAEGIVHAAGPPAAIVELGSGTAGKTRILLEALLAVRGSGTFHPLDISQAAIEYTEETLSRDYGGLTVRGFVGEYHEALLEVEAKVPAPRLFAWLGSSIGNLEPDDAVDVLGLVRRTMEDGEAFLLGTDMVKPEEVLVPAYDDEEGITEEFNKNLLHRINRELGGEFAPGWFDHEAVWNPEASRMEIYLTSTRDQEVRIRDLDLTVRLDEGERIHTENSYKYTPEMVEGLARKAGLAVGRSWYDDDRWFGLHLLRRA